MKSLIVAGLILSVWLTKATNERRFAVESELTERKEHKPVYLGLLLNHLKDIYGETLESMGMKLGVTKEYLRLVIVGERNPPKKWAVRLARLYNLNEDALKRFFMANRFYMKIDTRKLSIDDKMLAYDLTKKFNSLSDAKKRKIADIINFEPFDERDIFDAERKYEF